MIYYSSIIIFLMFCVIVAGFATLWQEKSETTDNIVTTTIFTAIPDLSEILKDALNSKNKVPMYFMASTLCIDNVIGQDSVITLALTHCNDFLGNVPERQPSNLEKYLYAQLYVKHKTPEHSYYDECSKYINEYLTDNPVIM